MLIKVCMVSFALLLGACSQTETKIEIIRIPVVTEVPVEVIVEVVKEIEVIKEVPVEVIVEVPVLPTWCPAQQEINNILTWLEEGRASHVWWSDYLTSNELQDPLARQGLGTAGFHQEWVARYTTMIGVTQAVGVIC